MTKLTERDDFACCSPSLPGHPNQVAPEAVASLARAALAAAAPLIAKVLEDVAAGMERDLWLAGEPGGYYAPTVDGEEQHAILTPAAWVRTYSRAVTQATK